jgi:uncharacterized protein YndB with AHSA1/START domain
MPITSIMGRVGIGRVSETGATMPEAHRTIVIGRSPDAVFAFFTDPNNDPRWRPIVKKIAADGPVRVGSVVHQVVTGPGGRGSFPADYEVTAYEPPLRFAFRVIKGPVRPVGEFRFALAGRGTEVSFSITAELGLITKLFLGKQVQNAMDLDVAALDKAKELIEST